MTTDLGPQSLSVSPEEIATHAETVDAFADRSEVCAATVRHLRLDTGAYGQLCGFVPAVLNGITSTIETTSVDASGSLRETAGGLRRLVPHFTAADEAAGRLGSGTPALDNPLIAPRIDSTTWFSGVGIYETFDLVIESIRSGTWVDVMLAGVGTAVEVVAWGLDPIGMAVAAGLGWVVEHVSFLSDAMDWLAGDPDQVNAHAQTWANAAVEQFVLAEEYRRSVETQLPSWSGEAAHTYRLRAAETADLLTALGKSYETMSTIITSAGTLVAIVRALVRDLIAQCIVTLTYWKSKWAAVEAASLGFATPYIAAEVSTLVARFSNQIVRLLHALISSLNRLATHARQLDELITTIQDLLRRRWGGHGALPQLQQSATHPNVYFGPLGEHFQPGVGDINNVFEPKEYSIAEYFAARGVNVEAIEPIHNRAYLTNPDSIFRWSPDDRGTLTEMKTLQSADSTAVRRDILVAGEQLAQHGGGAVVIDGRDVGLTEADARRGYARALGQAAQHQKPLPDTLYVILGDGSLIELPDR